MQQESEHSFIVALANLLTPNQVDTNTVSEALSLICKEFSLDSGFVYEESFSRKFCLTEQFYLNRNENQELFTVQELTLQKQDDLDLIGRDLIYLEKSPQNKPSETWLLDLFHAASLILVPIADKEQHSDEDWHIYGFILLMNSRTQPHPNSESLQTISAAAFMLIHYIEARIFRKRIQQSQATLENILDNMGIDIYVNDFYTHEILYVNKSMAAPYGGKELFKGQKCWQAIFAGQTGPCEFCPSNQIIDEQGIPTKVYTWDYQRPFDGSWFRVFSAAFYWVDGRLAHVISSANITDNKKNEALIENLANYDQLTRLPNRRMLLKECEYRIDKATATEQGYLLFFDIDGFKAINDNFGHNAGDEFLIQLGEFFTNIPILKDSIYRNGGDEFVAIVGGEAITKNHIISLSNFIHQRFKESWKLKNGEIFCNTSIGVACFPEDGVTGETLLQKADKAMYKVKKSGGGGLCFGYQLDADEASHI